MTVIDEPTQTGGKASTAGAAAAPSPGSNRITTIEPKRGLADLGFQEIWAYRDLLLTLAHRDVKLRYRQTALGVIWVVVQPVLSSIIFTVIFSLIGKGSFTSDGKPYFIFVFAGQMTWSAISSAVSRTSGSLLSNTTLVSKIFFPRLILPLSNIGAVFIDFGVSLVVLFLLMVVYQIPPTPALLLMPLFLLLITLGASGVGLIAAALTVSYRDIAYILPIILNLFMYASPVNYSVKSLPAVVKPFFEANPVTTLVNGMRWTLLGTPAPSLLSLFVITVVSIGTFVFGAFVFRSMEKRFADVI